MTDGQTDGQTDGRKCHIASTALAMRVAARCKNLFRCDLTRSITSIAKSVMVLLHRPDLIGVTESWSTPELILNFSYKNLFQCDLIGREEVSFFALSVS